METIRAKLEAIIQMEESALQRRNQDSPHVFSGGISWDNAEEELRASAARNIVNAEIYGRLELARQLYQPFIKEDRRLREEKNRIECERMMAL